jgi:hypothetical protein
VGKAAGEAALLHVLVQPLSAGNGQQDGVYLFQNPGRTASSPLVPTNSRTGRTASAPLIPANSNNGNLKLNLMNVSNSRHSQKLSKNQGNGREPKVKTEVALLSASSPSNQEITPREAHYK